MKDANYGYFNKNCREANKGLVEEAVLLTHETTDSAFLRIRLDEPFSMQGGVAVANYLDENGVRHALVSTGSHTVLVGSTGSGKTQGFYLTQIELLARSSDNVSFLAMDMKGTMYKDKADFLRAHGFKVVVLNGKEPYFSSRYNPMKVIYRAFHNAHDAERLVEQAEYGRPEYEFRGKKFTSYFDWRAEVEAYANEEMELSEQLTRLMVETLVPIESKKDTSWEQGAREIVSSVITMLLEDSLVPERGMTEEKFNLYNVSMRVNDRSDDYRITKKMLAMREKTSPALKLNNYVESAARQTRDSFMMTAGDKMCRIVNHTMNVMSTGSEIDMDEIVDNIGKNRMAIFCIADSSNKAAYTLCNLFLVQLVTMLQRRGDETTEGDFHIFADEFCNMVPMPGIVDWITTMRSRRVWFHLGLQSFAQMDFHYDENVRKTVVGNSKTIFMGSNDYKTLEEFSQSMGRKAAVANNFSMANDGSVNMSAAVTSVPLVKVSDLAALHLGEAYVRVFGPYGNRLMKTVLEPNFACKDFAHDNAVFTRRVGDSFDADEAYYDVDAIPTKRERDDDDLFSFRRSGPRTPKTPKGQELAEKLTNDEREFFRKALNESAAYEGLAAYVRTNKDVLYYRPHLVEIGLLAHGFSVRLGLERDDYPAFRKTVLETPAAVKKADPVADTTATPSAEDGDPDIRDRIFFETLYRDGNEGQELPFSSAPSRTRLFEYVRMQSNLFCENGGYHFDLPVDNGRTRIEVARNPIASEAADGGATLSFCDKAFKSNPAYTKEKVRAIANAYGVKVREAGKKRILVKPLGEEGHSLDDLFKLVTCIYTLRSFEELYPKA